MICFKFRSVFVLIGVGLVVAAGFGVIDRCSAVQMDWKQILAVPKLKIIHRKGIWDQTEWMLQAKNFESVISWHHFAQPSKTRKKRCRSFSLVGKGPVRGGANKHLSKKIHAQLKLRARGHASPNRSTLQKRPVKQRGQGGQKGQRGPLYIASGHPATLMVIYLVGRAPTVARVLRTAQTLALGVTWSRTCKQR